MHPEEGQVNSGKLEGLLEKLDAAIELLASAKSFARPAKAPRVLDTAKRVLLEEGGCAAIESRAERLEQAGIFEGSDWAQPEILVPSLARNSLQSADAHTVVIEALSELRLLAIAREDMRHEGMSAEQAHHFLTQVLALNLQMLFSPPSEAERETQGRLAQVPRNLLAHLAERIGYEHVIDSLIDEIWRLLRQRPIDVSAIKQMVTQIAICQADPDIDLGTSGHGADRLVSSLFGPTQASREDPGIEIYLERLERLDAQALHSEARGMSRAMHDTGLVSPYHAALLRFLIEFDATLLADALGLSSTGRECLLCYRDLVNALVDTAVFPENPQGVYGLALLLERGILYHPAVAPSLWRQISLELSEWTISRLQIAYGDAVSPRARLLEGVLLLLGLPLGVGQGNNPTCQSARAIAMWAFNDPDYLLQILASAARDDEIIMHFEGQPVHSRPGILGAEPLPIDLAPVSLVLVPHLDYVYNRMFDLCADREGDPHRWINPEFHGWWVGRGFRISVDVDSGQLVDLEDFLRHFYAYYHPFYNGNQPLIHPQPAGLAVTDSAARFIGWHAIAIQRVALDPEGEMRVYFFNPNNDSGQDWGDGVCVSTADHGEFFGESSLLFEEFASRVYIFHHDPMEEGEPQAVEQEKIDTVIGYIERSWGDGRIPVAALQASSGPENGES